MERVAVRLGVRAVEGAVEGGMEWRMQGSGGREDDEDGKDRGEGEGSDGF